MRETLNEFFKRRYFPTIYCLLGFQREIARNNGDLSPLPIYANGVNASG
jgi:hypothetical protein